MELSCGLDWISVTFPHDYNKKWQVAVLPFDATGYIEVKPLLGYTIATRHPTGAIMLTAPDSPRMGTHVIYSSQALASAEMDFGATQQEILTYLSRHGRISRLDVRLDIYDVQIDILKLHKQAKSGLCLTAAKSSNYVESGTSGNERGAATCYIGSQRKRKKLLRVYDKGAQLDLKRYQTRLELETRGDIARNAANRLKTANFADYATLMRGMIKDFACWPYYAPLVCAFSDTTMVHLDVPTHVRGNTARWLLNTVAGTLAREVILDSSLYTEFLMRVHEEIAIRVQAGSNPEQGAG